MCLLLAAVAGLVCIARPAEVSCQQIPQSKGADSSPRFVLVEKVSPGLAAATAGIRSGDKLLSWFTPGAHGEIASTFDLRMLEIEYGCRGPVRIEGLRGAKKAAWVLVADRWGLSGRPNMADDALAIYRQIRTLATAGKLSDVTGLLRSVVDGPHNIVELGPWLLNRAITLSTEAGHTPPSELDQAYEEAVRESIGAGPEVRITIFDRWADSLQDRDDLAGAKKNYEAELEEERKLGSQTIAIAWTLIDIGVVEIKQGSFLNAEAHFREALAIHKKLAPKAARVSVILGNLAVLAHDQGELGVAEAYYRQAISNDQGHADRAWNLALNLVDFGELEHRRGQLRTAYTLEARALRTAMRAHAPSAYIATILSFLGDVALDRGDIKAASEYQSRALAIRKREAPGSLSVALSLVSLGNIARITGHLDRAEQLYRQALHIGESLPSTPSELPAFLNAVGDIAIKRRDWDTAQALYARSTSLANDVSPSWDQFDAHVGVARVARHKQQWDSSMFAYKSALDILGRLTAGLGGSDETRSEFRALHVDFYREYISFLIEQKQVAAAFEVSESARARTLLELLRSAHADIHQGMDPNLLNRERSLQRLLNTRQQHRVQLLSTNHTDLELATLDEEIAGLLEKYHGLEGEIRTANPNYADLINPSKLGVAEIQALLGPDTLLLEYSLGDDHSYVWAVTTGYLEVRELPSRRTIEIAARKLYWAITARTTYASADRRASRNQMDAECAQAAANLTRLILAPLDTLLEGKRLVIVSDGALQYIPFAALPSPNNNRVPLAAQQEIVNLPSASVLYQIREAAKDRTPAAKAVAILADPVFDSNDDRVRPARKAWIAGQSAEPTTIRLQGNEHVFRSASDIGLTRGSAFHLARLIYTREESRTILAAAPHGQTLRALDFQASRATAMSSELGEYRIVHFATHGLLDSRHPEFSGLVLSLVDPRGRPVEGFLGLEDIYNMKLSADLIVLSGCQTGLGQEISGEGLVGLTRGFMYAGAPRVVASLWNVSDLATSQFMTFFYKALLGDSMTAAAALRYAQIRMRGTKRWHSLFYWGAFQLQGDWR